MEPYTTQLGCSNTIEAPSHKCANIQDWVYRFTPFLLRRILRVSLRSLARPMPPRAPFVVRRAPLLRALSRVSRLFRLQASCFSGTRYYPVRAFERCMVYHGSCRGCGETRCYTFRGRGHLQTCLRMPWNQVCGFPPCLFCCVLLALIYYLPFGSVPNACWCSAYPLFVPYHPPA